MHKTLYNISRGQVLSKHFFRRAPCVRRRGATVPWHNGTMASPGLVNASEVEPNHNVCLWRLWARQFTYVSADKRRKRLIVQPPPLPGINRSTTTKIIGVTIATASQFQSTSMALYDPAVRQHYLADFTRAWREHRLATRSL